MQGLKWPSIHAGSLWAGISLTVASPHQSISATVGTAEEHGLDNVVRLAVPNRVTDSVSESEAAISPLNSLGMLHQVEFGNQRERLDDPGHPVELERTREDSRQEVGDTWAPHVARHSMRMSGGYRSGLRSRPSRLSTVSVKLDEGRADALRPQTPIADRIRLDRVLSELKGMMWVSYPVRQGTHEQ